MSTKHMLSILDLTEKDFVNYTCVAINKYGESRQSIELVPKCKLLEMFTLFNLCLNLYDSNLANSEANFALFTSIIGFSLLLIIVLGCCSLLKSNKKSNFHKTQCKATN